MIQLGKKALILISATIMAAMVSGLYVTAHATAISGNSTQGTSIQCFGDQMMGGRGHGPGGCGLGRIEVSTEYNQTVMNIVNSDSDVKNLISQGYSVQDVRPIIKSVVQADGTVVTKATTAIVTLVNGTTGRAAVTVDVTNAKVTQIVIETRTVITK